MGDFMSLFKKKARYNVKKILLSISNPMSTDSSEPETVPSIKVCKEARYYYRHREEILARRREKLLATESYQAKLQAKAEKQSVKESERERLAEAKRVEKERIAEEKRLEKARLAEEKRIEKARMIDEGLLTIEKTRKEKAILKQEEARAKKEAEKEAKRLEKARFVGAV